MALLARVAAGGVRRRVRRADRWPLPTSIHYYHFDGLGSVIALTDSSGSVVNLYEYSVYGEVSASDPNHPNRFLFTGREFDKDTALYYYRARYYNPYIGRFLQTDPMGDGYAYCGNDPLNSVDPSGCKTAPTPGSAYPALPWYEFTVTFPAEVLSYAQGPFAPGNYFLNVERFFESVGLFDRYPDWILISAELKDGQEGLEQPLLTVTYRTAYYIWELPEPAKPRIGWRNVRSDLYGPGNKIPVLTINEYSILTRWNLERIIRPEIERINKLPIISNPYGDYMPAYKEFLELESWDTPLVGDKNKWTYNVAGEVTWWLGEEINYIAGGHLLAHYGFSQYMAKKAGQFHNLRFFRFWWKDEVKRRMYWLLDGYDNYALRHMWGAEPGMGTLYPN